MCKASPQCVILYGQIVPRLCERFVALWTIIQFLSTVCSQVNLQTPRCSEWPITQLTGEGPVCNTLHGRLQAMTGRLGGVTVWITFHPLSQLAYWIG